MWWSGLGFVPVLQATGSKFDQVARPLPLYLMSCFPVTNSRLSLQVRKWSKGVPQPLFLVYNKPLGECLPILGSVLWVKWRVTDSINLFSEASSLPLFLFVLWSAAVAPIFEAEVALQHPNIRWPYTPSYQPGYHLLIMLCGQHSKPSISRTNYNCVIISINTIIILTIIYMIRRNQLLLCQFYHRGIRVFSSPKWPYVIQEKF